MSILVAVLTLGLLGVAFSILLAYSFKRFAVKVDPRVEQVQAVLPGANCGACGYAGCIGLAEAIVAGKAEAGGCVAGGNAVAAKVAELMGVSLNPTSETVAFVACRAGRGQARKLYSYEGVDNCQAANLLFGGDKLCSYGCLGLGSCARACPFGAIRVNAEGLAVVDRAKCRSCRKCVAACPRKLIAMVAKTQEVLVACANHDKGRRAKEVCEIACTACRICEKNCPAKCIVVPDGLSVIDYAKCTQCGTCVEKCPQKSIRRIAKTNGGVAAKEKAGAAV